MKKPYSQNVVKMSETLNIESGVNRTDSASSSRVFGEEQPAPGRNPATARIKWTKEVNKIVMKCYTK